jgi:hypothetical protein
MSELGVWLGQWRAAFAAADDLERLQVRARLARLAAGERDPGVAEALSDLLAEMRTCR